MAREYVENRDCSYYLIGSRVSLESVIFLFLDGASPETIVDEFPTLSLEQVYGAITFYLADRAKIDGYLTESETLWEEARKDQLPLHSPLRERLERVRREETPHPAAHGRHPLPSERENRSSPSGEGKTFRAR